MSHVIFSRSASNNELSAERIATLAPAVFATTRKETLSPRYGQLHTDSLLPVMRDHGFVPVQAAQKRSRKASPEHSQHMIAFSQVDGLMGDGGIRPEIILYNSHDGSGSIKLFAGAFRFICSNGIVAGDGFQSRLYHSISNINAFEGMLTSTIERLPTLMERIEQMQAIKLDRLGALELATQAVESRWSYVPQEGTRKGSYADRNTVEDILKVNRFEDYASDSWTVLNKVQENVIRGGALIKSFTEKHPEGQYRKSRPVSSVAENVRINRELWDIAAKVCQLA